MIAVFGPASGMRIQLVCLYVCILLQEPDWHGCWGNRCEKLYQRAGCILMVIRSTSVNQLNRKSRDSVFGKMKFRHFQEVCY